MHNQTLLDLFDNHPTLDNFITDDSNLIIVNALRTLNNQYMHITGGKHSGKTHLLKAWCNQTITEQNSQAIYINSKLYMLENPHPELSSIRNLANRYKFIAIDNIENLDDAAQIELFDLFNSIKLNNRQNFLLTSNRGSLEQIHIRDDLKTRILSGLYLHIKPLADEDMIQKIGDYCKNEGINIHENELKYLVNHYTRNIGTLIQTLNHIVDIAVQERRNITIPLIKKVVGHE